MKHVLALALTLSFLTTGHTQETKDLKFDVFSPEEIREALGEYPELGTAESDEDFFILRYYQRTRTQEQCRIAAEQDSVTLRSLYARNGGPLTDAEALRLTPRLLLVYAEAGANIYIAKNLYKRPRPYLVDETLTPCAPEESSYAYPSGHTTLAYVLAHVLTDIYPERAEALMDWAKFISENRVLGGVHHPSDLVAGKKLAQMIAESFLERNR